MSELTPKRAQEAYEAQQKAGADRRQTFGDMEQIYRRWKNGVRYDVLAKEQGVTRERMRHRLLRYEDDKVRQLEAELAEARMQALSELGQAQEAYEAQKKAEAERDAAHKRGLEDAAKIAQTYSSSRHLAHDMKCGTFPRRTKVSEYLAAAIRAKIQESDDA